MREHLDFLKISSAAVKVAAWIFLLLGAGGSILVFAGRNADKSIIEGLLNLALSVFLFFFFFLIAKMADLMIKIIHEIKKEDS